MGFTLASVCMCVLCIVTSQTTVCILDVHSTRYIKVVFVGWEVLTNQYELVGLGPTSVLLFVFELLCRLSPPSYY